MPRENKKRGRRAEAARKLRLQDFEVLGEVESTSSKRRRTGHSPSEDRRFEEVPWVGRQPAAQVDEANAEERPFYGLLDEQEQDYFKMVDGILEADNFADQEERNIFLQNVYKEAEGSMDKATSFLNLVQHRFASHCCETLFVQSACVVTQELCVHLPLASLPDNDTKSNASMEQLLLSATDELSGSLGFIMTDRFASHTLRILLAIFSGQSLDTLLLSKRPLIKNRLADAIGLTHIQRSQGQTQRTRAVPNSFVSALQRTMMGSVGTLDSHYLQSLATHPIGNPVLQLLVQIELTQFRNQMRNENSVFRKLLPADLSMDAQESSTFINGLLYDPIGSRLLEKIIIHAPGKIFKTLYNANFKSRMGSITRNEIAAYVAGRVLERLSKDDLHQACEAILPQIPSLAQYGRTAIIRTLIERCRVRGLDTTKIRDAIRSCWIEDNGQNFSISLMLEIPSTAFPKIHEPGSREVRHEDPKLEPAEGASRLTRPVGTPLDSEQSTSAIVLHRSLLAQAMLSTPGPLSEMLFEALSTLSSTVCLHLALAPTLSPVLQRALTVPHASLLFRRKMITRFYSHIGALSLDRSGSHLVDAIWSGTLGMAFVRERIAEELAENETSLRASSFGRKVWKNWKMDLYRTRRAEWVRMVRGEVGNKGFQSFPDGVGGSSKSPSTHTASLKVSKSSNGTKTLTGQAGLEPRPKTKLDLARERYARQKNSIS